MKDKSLPVETVLIQKRVDPIEFITWLDFQRSNLNNFVENMHWVISNLNYYTIDKLLRNKNVFSIKVNSALSAKKIWLISLYFLRANIVNCVHKRAIIKSLIGFLINIFACKRSEISLFITIWMLWCLWARVGEFLDGNRLEKHSSDVKQNEIFNEYYFPVNWI